MKRKSEAVFYVDGLGRVHAALITAINVRGSNCATCNSYNKEQKYVVGGWPCTDAWHTSAEPQEHYVSLVYVDENKPEAENILRLFDVPHVSMLPPDPNSSLPTYHVNCWKTFNEPHKALPLDHPGFDHPSKEKERDQDGNIIPIARPAFAAEIEKHLAEQVQSQNPDYPELRAWLGDYDSIFYGPHPCLDCGVTIVKQAIEQGGVAYESAGAATFKVHPCQGKKPSAEDLDKVAEEEKAKEDTSQQ